ncbi:hypothetical protein GALMADRAFT_136983 [Galerina marginata CBS 339.88]|uniref:Uncharacterized protein n=1 Tax=Galerina marginata (strain CBS 339.88) TaxID=685588 RepID=A0A067T7C2_GALM3|nr:hypothetical protein GALMADRAFT_136983 [Galerina marginata CBS 339.88]
METHGNDFHDSPRWRDTANRSPPYLDPHPPPYRLSTPANEDRQQHQELRPHHKRTRNTPPLCHIEWHRAWRTPLPLPLPPRLRLPPRLSLCLRRLPEHSPTRCQLPPRGSRLLQSLVPERGVAGSLVIPRRRKAADSMLSPPLLLFIRQAPRPRPLQRPSRAITIPHLALCAPPPKDGRQGSGWAVYTAALDCTPGHRTEPNDAVPIQLSPSTLAFTHHHRLSPPPPPSYIHRVRCRPPAVPRHRDSMAPARLPCGSAIIPTRTADDHYETEERNGQAEVETTATGPATVHCWPCLTIIPVRGCRHAPFDSPPPPLSPPAALFLPPSTLSKDDTTPRQNMREHRPTSTYSMNTCATGQRHRPFRDQGAGCYPHAREFWVD